MKRSTFVAPTRVERIRQTECPTCGAAPGKKCVSVIDRKSTIWHVGRKQKALLG